MKELTIVIVNYNARHFLELALRAVSKAIVGLDAEVFVVDNNSKDASVQMIKDTFPEVVLICNQENLGFSKANNLGIAQSSGEFVLLLNPDTIVAEDTFVKCLAFMHEQPKSGGLGVKMIDGTGKFLPESKRGLPTPWVSFCKMSGLANLFPKSSIFGRYHVRYLDKDKTHEVPVLSGAFMLLRKSVLDDIGGLDEDYFMYGEDIDLSYQITKAGFKNYYFADAPIIHFKGECTKDELESVRVFYHAMVIFSKKHFKQYQLLLYVIRFAIFGRVNFELVYRALRDKFRFLFCSIVVKEKNLNLVMVGSEFSLQKAEELYKKNNYQVLTKRLIKVGEEAQDKEVLVFSALSHDYKAIIEAVLNLKINYPWKILSENGAYLIGKASKDIQEEVLH